MNDELKNYIDDAIRIAIQDALSNLHTNLIAKVTKVNATTINAKPVINRMVDGESIELPEFIEIPVFVNHGGASSLQMPISAGDYCILMVMERNFDNWYFGKDFTEPLNFSMHDYSDCVALVGLYPKSKELPVPNIVKINGNVQINGTLTVSTDVVTNGISLKSHTHGGVQAGGSDTGVPK